MMRIVLALALVLSNGEAVCWAQRNGPKDDRTVCVVIRPTKGMVEQTIRVPGSLEAFEKVSLYAKVTGYVESLKVDMGDAVKKGQLLATLTLPELQQDLLRSQAEHVAARAQLHKAQAEAELTAVTHERLAGLRQAEPGAVTRQDVDIAAANEKVAAAQVGIAKADVRVAATRVARNKALLAYGEIRSPFDGVITKRIVDTGALLEAGKSGAAPLVEIVRAETLRLAIDIPEKLVSLVRRGNAVTFTLDALPGKSFDGTIARVAGALKPDVRSMRAEIDVPSRDGLLKPGMYAQVTLLLQELPNVLTLPAVVLRPRAGKHGVFIVEQGRVRWVPVSIIKDDGASVVVEGEINEQTVVVLSSLRTLHDGQQVHVRAQER